MSHLIIDLTNSHLLIDLTNESDVIDLTAIDLTNESDTESQEVESVGDNAESPEGTEWQEGFCPTCCEINRIQKSYCKYNCEYRKADDFLWTEYYNRFPGRQGHISPKFNLKGWQDGFWFLVRID